jgi:hypothetical protein
VVLAASLAAHVALLAAWMSTRPEFRMVEPPTLQVALIRPPPRQTPKPRSTPPPNVATPLRSAETPVAAERPAPPPALPPAPRVLDVPRMTDQELTAGPRPDLAKIYADEARQPLTRNGVPTDGCKPAWEHSERIAPPCPIRAAAPLPRNPSAQLPNRPDMAAEAAYKNTMKTYREAPGDAAYPGLACAILHKCKP